MSRTPTYKELEQRIKELENTVHGHSRIEEELSKSEELHRIILSNLSDTVLITDESGTFTFVCPNVNVIFGYSRDDVLALGNVKKLLGGQLVDYDRLQTLHEIHNIEREIVDKSGKKHALLVNVKRVSVNGGTLLYACRDITARKSAEKALIKAYDELEERVVERTQELTKTNDLLKSEVEERKEVEDALRTSEDQKKSILNASIDRIRYVDKDMRIIWANRASAMGTKMSAEELKGEHCYELCAGENTPCEKCPTVKAMKTGKIERAVIHYPKIRGGSGERYEDSYCVPLENKKGDVDRFVQVSRDITERKHAEKQIHTLTHQLIKAQESERQMISRELHDSVAQDLSSMKIVCEMLLDNQPEVSSEIKQKVTEMSEILHRTIMAIRDLSYDLRPSGLDELGLEEVISQYCEDFSKKNGITVDFHSAGLSSLKPDFDTDINLYRILQEGLNNILKHADASYAKVRLVGAFPNVILRVEDNGRGFDVEKTLATMHYKKRMGLRSMKERVHLLKGTMTIKSHPREGTKIIMRIPYKEKKSDSKEDHIDR
jgi:PAS domain S-box-containing protein